MKERLAVASSPFSSVRVAETLIAEEALLGNVTFANHFSPLQVTSTGLTPPTIRTLGSELKALQFPSNLKFK